MHSVNNMNMNSTKNEMPLYAVNFFSRIEKYLDTKIYYFGSVQRDDYFFGASDIDTCIFTTNESSTIWKLQNLFNKSKYEFKKFINYLPTSKKIVNGYILNYKDTSNNFSTDIIIYNEKYKEDVLKDNKYKIDVPFYITFLLLIVKTMHYKLYILPKSVYTFFKKLIMDILDDGVNFLNVRTNTWKFMVFEIPNDPSKKEN